MTQAVPPAVRSKTKSHPSTPKNVIRSAIRRHYPQGKLRDAELAAKDILDHLRVEGYTIYLTGDPLS